MIGLDVGKLAPEIAALIMGRGSGLPSLSWHQRPIPLAKQTLDTIEDVKLFGGNTPDDEAMAAGVRALLYLWNGFSADAGMHAQGAAQAEGHFIAGICERQYGQATQAKAAFRLLAGHPIFKPLGAFVLQVVNVGADAQLRRFGDLVKLGQTWEPFAFVDLHMLAEAGKFTRAAEEAVCTLQRREFELLFIHSYHGATGVNAAADSQTSPAPPRKRKRPAARSQQRRTRPPESAPQPAAKNPSKKAPLAPPLKPPAAPAGIGIRCPRCGDIAQVSKSARGKAIQCKKCQARFLVPAAKPALSKAAATPGQ
ncbi:MAG: hypothetical protein IID40_06980 [Planctomycetes bacterium]|nr:hypothetical protein [Planctomycetota bacterium]